MGDTPRRSERKRTPMKRFMEENEVKVKRIKTPPKLKSIDQLESIDKLNLNEESESNYELKLNVFEEYKRALSNTVQTELLFRENETNEIRSFFEVHLKSKKSSSIYISGPPGVGKTATITSILDKLSNEFTFQKLFLNGMSFTTTNAFYNRIFSELTDEISTSKDMVSLIVKELKRKGRKMVILVLDEIDILDDRHQEMLNTIFSLPKFKSAKVIIVGIANTLGLTSSKMTRFNALNIDQIKEVAFESYDAEKISGILESRIQALNKEHQLVDASAIKFCGKSVAKNFGDARKALEIMRRSVELLEQESDNLKLKEQNNQDDKSIKKKVTVSHVSKIVHAVFSSKAKEVDDDDYKFPIQQKLVLCLILLFNKEGDKNPELGKCFDRFLKTCKERDLNFECANASNFLDVCEQLEVQSFIQIKKSRNLRQSRLSLSIDSSEAEKMLEKNKTIKYILS